MQFQAWEGLSDAYRAAVNGHSPWTGDDPAPKTIKVPDALHDAAWAAYAPLFKQEGIRSLAFVPVVYEGRLLGKVMVYFDEPHDFTGNEVRLAEAFASHIAIMIHRSQAEDALRQSEKLAAAGRLAATVAHEINNPLEAVVNLVYLAKNAPAVSEHVKQFLELAETELQRVSYLSKQTLGFYRESRGAEPTRIASHMEHLINLLTPRLRNKAVDLKLEVVDDPEIIAIPSELKQLFANLLSNSIDAVNSRGKIRVRVASQKDWKNGRRPGVQVTISDTGSGIAPGNRKKIFEPFFTTKQDVGTGLGLWVCNSIVKKHAGRVRVRSSVKPGNSWTVFSLFLPCRTELKSAA